MSPLHGATPPMGTAAGESLRALLVSAGFLLIFAADEEWRRRFGPPVEWTRKFVHFAGGLLVAAFPWLFASRWTVLALAVAFAGIIGLSRSFGLLGSVHGVERRSEGALYYPIAICLLFMVSRGHPVLYLISILTLVLADALAAVVGSTYGRCLYEVEADRKSVEGSVAFFLTTFLVVYLPLLLLTEIDRGVSVLIGAQVALLVTCFEAISLRGSDNLIIPLATYYLLVKMTARSTEWLGMLLLAQIGVIIVIGLLAWRTRFLTFSGAIAAHLVLYAALSLGGPRWALAMVLALAGVVVLEGTVRRQIGAPGGGYQVLAVFYTSLVAVLLLLISNTLTTLLPMPWVFRRGNPFYGPFVGALAGQLAILAYQELDRLPSWKRAPSASRALAAGGISFMGVAPISLWGGMDRFPGAEIAVAGAIAFGAVVVYNAGRRRAHRSKTGVPSLRIQAASVALVTGLVTSLYLRWLGII
jgi:phytol kinase